MKQHKLPFVLRKKQKKIIGRYFAEGVANAVDFNYEEMKSRTLSFVKSLQGEEVCLYKYTQNSKSHHIYSSIYACMIMSLYDEIRLLNREKISKWVEYLDSFQSPTDGMFRDKTLENDIFESSDWWGCRHLAVHAISAYTALNARPRHKFSYLEPYYSDKYMLKWLNSIDWENTLDSDADNKIMNIGCLLQYTRDTHHDKHAGQAVEFLKNYLIRKINIKTGLWGPDKYRSPKLLSRAIQFAYHIFTILFYDNWIPEKTAHTIRHTLWSQNLLGGFGTEFNSSACEDIDSIYVLNWLYPFSGTQRKDIRKSLSRTLPWVLSNQNRDGGFVFKRGEPFSYGHADMSSGADISSMFATWFRTLSLAYLNQTLNFCNGYKINKTPGYEHLQ